MTAQAEILRLHRLIRERDRAAAVMLDALRAAMKHIDDDMNNRPVSLWKIRATVWAAIAKAERKNEEAQP